MINSTRDQNLKMFGSQKIITLVYMPCIGINIYYKVIVLISIEGIY
jgi:hypothetical protein